jgi:hypothetical protein
MQQGGHLTLGQNLGSRPNTLKSTPFDPASVDVMIGSYDATRPKKRPTDPASVDVMTGSYQDGRNLENAPPTPRRWT